MRALFILLFIYFLTAILQVSGARLTVNEDDRIDTESKNAELEYNVSYETARLDSLLEDQDDHKDYLRRFCKIATVHLSQNTSLKSYISDHLPAKNIFVLHTNLPPPLN